MEDAKKVANENFDWNAFENDLGVYDQPKEQIGEAYDKTLSKDVYKRQGLVTPIWRSENLSNIGF